MNSHKWADFPHNWAENHLSFPQMGRFSPQMGWKLYVIPTNGPILRWQSQWRDVTFPNDTNRKSKKKKTLGTGDHYTVRAGAGNQFRAAAVASEDPSDVYVKIETSSTMNSLIQFSFLVVFLIQK